MQLSALTSALGRFVSELQRRKVIRVAAGYVVGAWIVLQVALALQAAMTLSASFSAAILALLVIAFPVSLVLTWFFEITPEGVRRTVAAGDGALLKPQTPDYILAAMLALVLVVALVQAVMPREATQAPVATTVTADAPKAKPEPPVLGDKSIAVLPFANLSPDKENEYFADGLTEELLNLLAKIGDLKVISRTSSFAFKGKNTPLPEIAKQLGVRHILEGTVRSEGDDLRITAQLIDVTTDTHLWSQTYERKIEGVFDLQDDLARDIAGALKVEVALSGSGRDAPTKNLNAYRLYLQGLDALRNRDEAISAADLFKSAIAEDAEFAEAHAMFAVAYGLRADVLSGAPSELTRPARASANAAIKLKPKLALGYAVLGWLDRREGHWVAGMAKAAKAVALDPADSYVRYLLGSGQFGAGQVEAARLSFLAVLRTDPLFDAARAQLMATEAARGNRAVADGHADELTKSTDRLATALAHSRLATAAIDRGDGATAAQHYLSILPSALRDRPFAVAVAAALKSPKAKNAAVAALKAETRAPEIMVLGSFIILRAYDPALDFLGSPRASEWRGGLSFMWGPGLTNFRNDPRFKDFMRKVGLVDYWKKHGWPDRCRAKGEDDFECS